MSGARGVAAGVGGALVATAIGGLAAYFHDEDALVTWLVFGLMTWPCFFGLGVILLTPAEDGPPEHNEDSIEMQWMETATSGAFLDLVIALGIGGAVTEIADVNTVPTVAFIALAMIDVALRYVMLQRREA